MTYNEYAKKEFEVYFKNQKPVKDEQEEKLRKHLEETIESIGMIVDQSVFSANILRAFIDRMLRYRTFYPLSGEDDEWELLQDNEGDEEGSVKAYVNKRCPTVIKYVEASGKETAVDLNALVFKDSNGRYFKDPSRAKVIEFPYNPPICAEEVLDEQKEEKEEETDSKE